MADKKSRFGISVILAAVAGVVAGLFLSEKPGKKLREKTKEEYLYFKELFTEKEADEAIKEIFGRVSQESRDIFNKTVDELSKALSDLKQDLTLVDKDKYKKLVGDVTKKIKKERKLPDDILKKLTKYFEDDFSKIKNAKKKTKSSKKTVNKTSKK